MLDPTAEQIQHAKKQREQIYDDNTGQMKKNRLKIVQAICEYLSRFLVIFVRFASI